jgi:hypothetical protein
MKALACCPSTLGREDKTNTKEKKLGCIKPSILQLHHFN